MIEVGLEALLKSNAPLTALLAGRIYPVVIPPNQDVWPCLTYQVVSGDSEYCIGNEEVSSKRFQFDAFSRSYLDCKKVLTALRDVLSGFSGTLADGTRVISASRSVPIDNFEDDARVYRSLCEYEIEFVEP